jgi:hypothetical protein
MFQLLPSHHQVYLFLHKLSFDCFPSHWPITQDDMLTYRKDQQLSLNVHIGQCEGSSQKRAYVKTDIPDDDSVRVETCCNLKVIKNIVSDGHCIMWKNNLELKYKIKCDNNTER